MRNSSQSGAEITYWGANPSPGPWGEAIAPPKILLGLFSAYAFFMRTYALVEV